MSNATHFSKIADHTGEDFYVFLNTAHASLTPSTYVEIGTATGASLALASCRCIAIDPGFNLKVETIGKKECCHFYQQTSDKFFESVNPTKLLSAPIDMAFLDGMHHFEFLLRDFYNVEKYCKESSVIFLHDCIPTDSYIARRDPDDSSIEAMSDHPGWWAGDLWKTVLILQRYRPLLKIFAFAVPPTGMIAITGLDPSSNILRDEYQGVVQEYAQLQLTQTCLDNYISSLDFRDSGSMREIFMLNRC